MRSIRQNLRATAWTVKVWTSEEWVRYYEHNARNRMPLPWDRGAELTEAERAVLAASLQDFQLGESSEGIHLRERAERYAQATDDPAYAAAMALFIGEEQRHAAVLGEFLRAADVPLREKTRLDSIFRWARRRAGLELFICVLLTAEMVGKVYYRAVWRASRSRLLRGICAQLLRDEVQHVRFHRERLAMLRQRRPAWKMWLTSALHRAFHQGTCLAVWLKHRRAFRAGGVGFLEYWRQCRQEWRAHRRQSDPSSYGLSVRETMKRATPDIPLTTAP